MTTFLPLFRAEKSAGKTASRSWRPASAALAIALAAGVSLTAFAGTAEAGHERHGHGQGRGATVHHHHHYIDSKHHQGRGYREDRHHARSERGRGGPPPWAPAHGYRENHRDHYRGRGGHDAPAPVLDLGAGRCYRESVGLVLGGATGAILGSGVGSGSGQLVAIAGGAILGSLLGGDLGRSLDRLDYGCMGHALEYAPTGQSVAWQNPDGGADYQITPVATYQSESGGYCREYTAAAVIGGRMEETYGTACRQPDGDWEIVN